MEGRSDPRVDVTVEGPRGGLAAFIVQVWVCDDLAQRSHGLHTAQEAEGAAADIFCRASDFAGEPGGWFADPDPVPGEEPGAEFMPAVVPFDQKAGCHVERVPVVRGRTRRFPCHRVPRREYGLDGLNQPRLFLVAPARGNFWTF